MPTSPLQLYIITTSYEVKVWLELVNFTSITLKCHLSKFLRLTTLRALSQFSTSFFFARSDFFVGINFADVFDVIGDADKRKKSLRAKKNPSIEGPTLKLENDQKMSR